MIDFSSALYLGLWHSSKELPPWPRLTAGAPAALVTSALAARVEAQLAHKLGCQRAVLARSTFHAFWDVLGTFRTPTAVVVDAGTYAIARSGVTQARARGDPVAQARHHDTAHADELLSAVRNRLPVMVTDGYCTGCGRVAPLPAYLRSARNAGGVLLVDDTQAVGVLGAEPDRRFPYGRGGGGSPAWHGVGGPGLILVSSLAKAFGAPLAVIAGTASDISRVEKGGEMRSHGSPPSAADLQAAAVALRVDEDSGDRRRRDLAELVARFRNRVCDAAQLATPGHFPAQLVRPPRGVDAGTLHQRLLRQSVRAVPVVDPCGPGSLLAFCITTRHRPADIDAAAAALRRVTGGAALARLAAPT